MLTNEAKIRRQLSLSSTPLDDDTLARRVGVRSRQTVNQICRRLAAAGALVRRPGPDGKIVNALTDTATQSPTDRGGAVRTDDELNGRSAGSSHEQRAAERVMLDVLGKKLEVRLDPTRIEHASGARVEIDGSDADRRFLVECWAHQGPAKVAQKYKLVNDATKLWWIAQSLPAQPERLVLCVSDKAAVRHLRGRSWQSKAIEAMRVEIEVVELPADIAAAVQLAQQRQYR